MVAVEAESKAVRIVFVLQALERRSNSFKPQAELGEVRD